MKHTFFYIALAVLAAAALFLLPPFEWGGPSAGGQADDHVTYICRETNAISTGPPQPTPAVNPQTGRPTLLRALYCERCRAWQPAPPSDAHQGNPLAMLCRKDGSALSLKGPLP